jgi:glycosyltransferase involved in cell wall biosynthesis
MKKILFISPTPPNHINRIRTLNLLTAWKGHAEVHYLCLAKERKDYEDIKAYEGLFSDVQVFWQPRLVSMLLCLAGLVVRRSLQVSYCLNRQLVRYLGGVDVASFDVIYIKRLRMAQYAKYLPLDKVWIDLTDSMGLHYSRMLKVPVSVTDKAIARYERKALGDFEKKVVETHKTIFCSRVDLEYASSHVAQHRALIVPNVVDLDTFAIGRQSTNSQNLRLCYWGNLKVPMNVTAIEILIRDIMPKILEKCPHFQLEIIGPNPPKRLTRARSGKIVFTGHVERLAARLAEMDLFICPLIFGTGVKNKILQSLAVGLPVLTTSIGIEGIEGIEELVERRMVFVEDTLSAYPDVVFHLMQHPIDDRREMREFIAKRYSVDRLRDVLANSGLL